MNLPGVSLAGAVAVAIDYTADGDAANDTLSVTVGPAATLTVAGESLQGTFTVERDGGDLKVTAAGVVLSIGDVVDVESGDGLFLVGSQGIAGQLDATATFTVPTLPISGSPDVAVQLNTRPAPVSAEFGTGAELTLPEGPYVRVELFVADADKLAVDTLGSISGSFFFQRQTVTGGDTVTLVGMSGVKAWVGNSGSANLTGGEGLLLITADGVAGYLSGTVAIDTDGVTAGGHALLRINTTGAAVSRTVGFGGRDVAIVFDTGDDVFSLSFSSLAIDIAGVVTIEGAITYETITLTAGSGGGQAAAFAGSGLKVFFGDGPATLADGSANPLARGILLAGATISLIKVSGSPDDFALDALGTVGVLGFDDAAVSGEVRVRVNSFDHAIDEVRTLASGAGLDLRFSDPGEIGVTGGPAYSSVSGTGLELRVLGQVLTGDVAFTRGAGTLTLAATDVRFTLRDGDSSTGARGPPIAQLSNGSGELRLSGAGAVGGFTGTLTLALDGVQVAGDVFEVLVNTTSQEATAPAVLEATDIPAGPFFRVSAEGAAITIAGQSVTGDFSLEQQTAGTATTTRLDVSNLTLTLGANGTDYLALQGGHGSLVAGPTGIAGRLSAVLQTGGNDVAGLTLGATLAIAVNTTPAIALGLPAGPYLRVEAAAATLAVAGQALSGDFAFERTTRALSGGGTQAVIRAVAANVRFSISSAGTPVVSLTDGAGSLLVLGADRAGELAGSVLLAIPGVTLAGTLTLQVNTTGADVDETFKAGGVDVRLLLPGGDAGADLLRVAGTDVVATVLGQQLAGDFAFERNGAAAKVTVAGASLSLAGGLVGISGAEAHFDIAADGVTGSFAGDVSVALPGVGLTGALSGAIDTTPAGGYVRISGAGVDLTVAGQTVTGDFTLQKGTVAGAAVVKVAVSSLDLAFESYVSIEDAAGQLVIAADGVAGQLAADAELDVPDLITTTAPIAVAVQVNTRPGAVAEMFTIGGVATAVSLPAGPFLRVELAIADSGRLAVGSLGSLSGSFLFQRQAPGGGAPVTIVGLAGVKAWIGADADPTLTDGEGAFLVTGDGVAGYLAGKAAFATGGVELGGSVLLRVNTTGHAVDQVISVGGRDITIAFGDDDGELFELSVTGASLSIAGVVTIEGNLTFSDRTIAGIGAVKVFAGSGLTVFFGDGPARLADGSPNPLARGILLTNATIGLIKLDGSPARYALEAIGSVELTGFSGASFSGQVRARVNSFGQAISEIIPIPGTEDAVTLDFLPTEVFTNGSPFSSVSGGGLNLELFGQTISGDFAFSRDAAGIRITAADVTFALSPNVSGTGARGPPALQLTDGHGELLLSSAGVTGGFGGDVTLNLPGVQLTAGSFDVLVDTTAQAATPLRVSGAGVQLTVAQQLVSGDFTFEQRTADGVEATHLTIANLTLALGDGATTYLQLSDGSGTLLVTPAGIAGRLSVQVDVNDVPGFDLSAGVSVAVNTTGAAAAGLPAGPYLRVEATAVAITVLGQVLTGDIAVERTTAESGPVVRIALRNVAFALTSGGQPVVTLSNGAGNVLLAGTGLAAELSGAVAVNVPGVALAGALRLQANTTGADVDEVFQAGGVATPLVLPSGPLGASFLRFAADDLTVDVLGQQLSGDFTFERSGASTTIAVTDASLSIGGGLVALSGAAASFTIVPAGVTGTFSGTATVALPGVELSGDLDGAIDTTPAGGFVRIEGTEVDLEIAGQTLTGDFTFERGSAGGASVVKVAVTNVDLSLESFVSIENASGQLVIAAGGVAGALTATATLSVPDLLSGSAAVAVQVNTRPGAVSEPFTIGGVATLLSLPAGPYVRVEVVVPETSRIAIGALGAISGRFLFERQTPAGGTPVTLVALADVKAWLGSAATPTLSAGEGAFVVSGDGVAGYASGRLAIDTGGVQVGGSALLQVNTTGAAVEQAIRFGGRDIVVTFGDPPNGADVFAVSVTGASINIANVVTIEGNVAFQANQTLPGISGSVDWFAGSGVKVFFGDGPSSLDDGSPNPLARGILLEDATIGLIRQGTGPNAKYALEARGTVRVIGFDGVTLAGEVRVRVNSFTTAIDQLLRIPGTDADVLVRFSAAEKAAGGTPFASVRAIGLDLRILGQTLSGDYTFTRAAGGLRIAAANVELALGDGGAPFLRLSEGAGDVLFTSAGIVGEIGGEVALDLDGVSLTGAFDVAFDTTPAGPYLKVAGAGATLTVGGQELTGDFSFEQVTEGAATVTRLTVANAALVLGDGTTDFLTLTRGAGSLVVTAAGIAGRLSADVAVNGVPGFALSGSVAIAVNTTPAAAEGLPAGPFLRVEATGVSVSVLAQTLTGDFSFERTTKTTATGRAPVVRVAVSNLRFALTSGGQPVLSLTGGAGNLLLDGTGLAADLGGAVVAAIPGVSLTGALRLQVNTTGAAVNELFSVAGVDTLLVLPAGTAGASYLRFAAGDLALDILGQRLSGDFAFEKSGTSARIVVAGGALSIAGGLVSVTGIDADLTITPAGTFGSLDGSVVVAVPGVEVLSDLAAEIDTRPATQRLRITGTGVVVAIAGVELEGDFSLERSTAGGVAVVKIAVAHAGLSLGDNVGVSGASGQFVVSPDGVAGQLTATATLDVPDLDLSGSFDVAVQVNTRPSAVSEPFEVGGVVTQLSLPAGPFLRVRVIVAETDPLVLPGGLGRLSGTFLFQRAGTVTTVAMAGVKAWVGTSADPVLRDGEGAFLVTDDGVAGYVTGKAAIVAGPVAVGGDVLLRVNTTGAAVDTTVDLGARSLAIRFGELEGALFEISVSNASLNIADFVTIEGDITFSDTTLPGGVAAKVFAGDGLTIFLGRGPAKLADGAANPLATGVQLTNGRIGLVQIGTGPSATYALVASGAVSLVGVAGVTIAGTVSVRVNTTGRAIDQTLTIPGSAGPGIPVTFANGLLVKRFEVTGAQISVVGQTIAGNLLFDKTGAGDVTIAATGVAISLGGGAVSVTGGAGALVLGPGGIAGRFSADVEVPGVGFTGTFGVALNTTAAPVDRSFAAGGQTVPLDLPAGPYLRVEGTGVQLTIFGQTLSGDFSIERSGTVTSIAAANVSFSLGAGGNGVTLSGGQGAFRLTPAGLAGRLSGQVALTLPAGVSVGGALSLAVNTTFAAVDEPALALPAGPYLRFEGTGLQVDVLGQRLAGDFVFERATSYGANKVPGGGDDSTVIRIGASNVSVAFGGATPVLTVTHGSGALLLGATGVAGSLQGTIALGIPQVSLTGTLALQVNTIDAAVDEVLKVGSATLALNVPRGPFVRVAGTGIDLSILGQALRGDVVVTRATNAAGQVTTRIDLANVAMRLGGTAAAPILAVTQKGAGSFLMTPAGLAGSIAATVAVNVPGVAFDGDFELAVDTAAAAPFLRVAATGIKLQVLGQELSGSFAVEQVVNALGQKVVRIGVSGAGLSLLSGAVTVSGGTGLFVLTPAGVAGSIGAAVAIGVTGVSLSGAFRLELNTTSAAVAQSIQVGGGTVAVALPAGPFLRVSGTGVALNIAGQTLSGDFTFERTTTTLGQTVRVGAANVTLALGDGTRNFLSLSQGEGLFLITAAGIAGRVSAIAALQNVPGVTLSGSLAVEVNTTSADVHESLLVGGLPRRLDVAAGSLRVSGTGIALNVLGQTLSGDFTFSKGPSKVNVAFRGVELALGDGTSDLVRVTGGTGDFTLVAGGVYGYVRGAVAVEVPNVKLGGTLRVEINTTADEQTVDGIDLAAGKLRIAGAGVTLTVAGQELSGSFSIERYAPLGGTPYVAIAVSGLAFKLGDPSSPLVHATGIKGAVLITRLGVAADLSTTTAPTFNLPGLGVTLASFKVRVNTGPVAVKKTFDVLLPTGVTESIPLDVAAGPLLYVEVLGATLCVPGSGSDCTGAAITFSGSFVLDQGSKPGFGAGTGIGAVAAATSLATGDVDQDGDLDVLLGTGGANQLLINDGTGAFSAASATLFAAGSDATKAVALADVDNDGALDMIVVNDGTSRIHLNRGSSASTLLGAGAAVGATTLAVSSTAGFSDTGWLVIGGRLIAYSAKTATSFTVSALPALVLNGTPVRQWLGFASASTGLATDDATAVAVGDVDGDGFADIVVGASATPGPAPLVLFTNRGTITTAGVTSWQGMSAATTIAALDTNAIALGDVDEDGDLDLVAAGAGAAHSVFLNEGKAATTLQGALTAAETATIAVASTDGFDAAGTIVVDGERIAYAAKTATSFTTLGRGAAGGSAAAAHAANASVTSLSLGFAAATTVANTLTASAIALGDVDGDGFLDAVVTGTGTGAATQVLINGGFTGATWDGFAAGAAIAALPGAEAAAAVALGDVDGDGRLDVVTGGAGVPTRHYANRGVDPAGDWLGFKDGVQIAPSGATTAVALANVDTDTDLDLLVARGATDATQLHRNEPVRVTRVGLTGVTVSLTPSTGAGSGTGAAELTISQGQGALILANGGIAGSFSGKVVGDVGDFDADITVAVRLNTTTSSYDESIVVGGVTLPIKFSSSETRVGTKNFVQVSGSGIIRFGTFVEISAGSISLSGTEIDLDDVVVFIGQGPGFLDGGTAEDPEISPDARGLFIKVATGKAIQAGSGNAIYATGSVSLVGIPGVAFSGDVTVQFNDTGTAQFVGTDFEVANGATSAVGDIHLDIAGQTLDGDFAFEKTATGFDVKLGTQAVAGGSVELKLGDPDAAGDHPFEIAITEAELTIGESGIYGYVVAVPSFAIPNVIFGTGPTELRINTTPDPQTVDGKLLPAGSVRVQVGTGTGSDRATISIAGQTLTGVFVFEQVPGELSPNAAPGSQPPKVVRIAAQNAALEIGDADAGVRIEDAAGFFVVSAAGLAGRIGGRVTFEIPGGGIDFTGTFTLAINTGTTAVAETLEVDRQTIGLNLPAGPYVRVEGSDVQLVFAGQRVGGDFVFEQATDATGTVTRIFARNVTAAFGDGTTSFATLDGGTGFFVLRSGASAGTGGLAGELSGTVAVTIPGIELSGTFGLAINNSTSAIDSTIEFGPQPTATNAVALGDVNGDSRPDLIVATGSGEKNLLYLNDGAGDPFDSIAAIEIGAEDDDSRAVVLADLDGDGDADLVVGNDGAGNRVYLNDGDGNFTLYSGTGSDLGEDGAALAAGDVDGDGDVDLVVGRNGAATQLYRNGGLASDVWQGLSAAAGELAGEAATQTTAVALADLDKDGDLDLVVANDGQSNVYEWNAGSFGAATAFGGATQATTALAIGDVDGDGFLDVIAGVDGAADRVHLNDGNDATTPTTWNGLAAGADVGGSASAATTALLLADLDGDGDLDLLAGVGGTDADPNRLYLNDGSGTFALYEDKVDDGVDLDEDADTTALASGDVDGDGNADVIAANASGGNRLLLGDGAGGLALAGTLGTAELSIEAGLGGPYLRITGTGVTLSVAGQTLKIGSFELEQKTLADASRVIGINVADAKLALGDDLLDLEVSGSLLVTSAGMAGVLTLDASLDLGPAIAISGDFEIRINTAPVAMVLDDADATRLPAGPYLRIEGTGVTISIADVFSLEASFAIEQTTNALGQRRMLIAVSGGKVSLGDAFPDVLTGVRGVLLRLPDGLAGQIEGTIDLGDTLPVQFSGSFGFAINQTGQAIAESVEVGGETLAVDLPAGPFVRIAGTNVQLTVAGQTLSGSFAIEQSGPAGSQVTVIAASDVTLRLGDGTTDYVTLSGGAGAFVIKPKQAPGVGNGIAGSLSGTVTLNVPGISFTGALSLELNTTLGAVTETIDVGGETVEIELDAGDYLRIGATDVELDVFGQRLSGDFAFEQSRAPDGARILRLAAANVEIFIGAGGSGLRVSGGEGQFLVTPAGVAGQISADIEVVGDLGDSISIPAIGVALAINTTNAAVDGLPAGPYLRVEVTVDADEPIVIFGQSLSGAFAFEQVTNAGADRTLNTSDDRKVIKIAATDVELFLGEGDVGVTISDGTALFLVTPEGVAGRISAGASIRLSDDISAEVELVEVAINSMRRTVGSKDFPVVVDEQFLVGGDVETLSLPAGPYLKIAVTGLRVALFGQLLTGDFSFEQITELDPADGSIPATPTTIKRITLANVGLRIGSPERDFVIVTNGHGELTITALGVYGAVAATVTVDVPGIVVSGTFEIQLNTTAAEQDGIAGESLKVTGLGVSVDVFGQRITGSFTFERDAVTKVVGIAVKDATLNLGNGTTTFVIVEEIEGAILIQPAVAATSTQPAKTSGIAAKLSATLRMPANLSDDFSLSATVIVEINTTNAAVDKTFTLGDEDEVRLQVAAGPYLRIQAGTPDDPADAEIFGQTLSGVFSFEQITTKAGAKVVKIGFTHVELFLGVGEGTADEAGIRLRGVEGLVLVTPQGVAGRITAAPDDGTSGFALVGIPGFSITTDLFVEFNSLTSAVNETFSFKDSGGATVTRTLQLAAGPLVRVAAYDTTIAFGTAPDDATIKGDFLFEKATRKVGNTTQPVLRIGAAKLTVTLAGATEPIIKDAYGAFVVLPKSGGGTGVAGVFLGHAGTPGTDADGAGFSLGADIGLGINTTGLTVNETVTVNGQAIEIKAAPTPVFKLLVKNLDFDFGGLIEIRGDFSFGGGVFTGDNLEVFLGSGPSRNDDGSPNPAAIGILITNASIHLVSPSAGQYAIFVKGTVALIGLDGLTLTGTVSLKINTTGTPQTLTTGGETATNMAPGTFAFQGTIQFKVGDLLDIGGTVVITRQPNGTLDLGLVGASVKVKVAGTEVFAISGTALFSISPLTGFRMQSFKVTGFSILGGIGLPVPTAPTPTGTNGTPATGLLPTADLASPFNGGKVVASDLSLNKYIDVQFTDRSGNGLKESTILDVEQEFDILVGGAPLAGLTVNGTPEKLANKVGVYRYRLLGTFAFPATGVVTVQFRANAFSDLSGAGGTGVPNVPETEQFYLVAAATGPGSIPPPIAVLASPGNGESLTAVDLNARGYIDVTYTSLDGKPILKSSIAQNAKFSITGSGVTADLQRDATTNVPVLVGTPLLIAGTAFDATSVTYRYFLRDVNNKNTVGLFQPGEVTIEFLRNDTTQTYFATSANPAPAAGETPASNGTTPATRNAAGVRQTFTLSPTAPGAAPTTAPLAIGPLTLLGPRIGIADVGFKDGMLVLTIAIGVDRASLGFNKPAAPNSGATTTPTTQQNSSGVTVDLIGVLGTFDLQVDALGLLSGNFRVNVPGKFALRVSSLEAEIPNVAKLTAEGIEVSYDPEGGAAQELVKINSATLLMPRFNIRGTIRPFDTALGQSVPDTGQTSGVIPGLVVRANGFTIGNAELAYGVGPQRPGTDPLQPGPADPKITFGSILELEDIRVGINNLSVTVGTAVDFNGSIYVASGGVKFLPGRPFSATITDRQTADDKNADGTPNDEAIRLQLTFSGGKVDAFQFKVDTMSITARQPRDADRARLHPEHGRERPAGAGLVPGDRGEGEDRRPRDRRRGAQLRLHGRRVVQDRSRASASSSASARPPATASSGRRSCRSGSTRSASSGTTSRTTRATSS